MKKVLVTLAAIGMLCALPGCNNRSDEQMLKAGQDTALQPMQQSWRGILPCADCEGIETSLFLEKDGTWARTAEKLVLTDSKGEKSYYRAKGDKLEMLDSEGNPIVSSLNYTLEPVKSSLPITPMAMRGMYIYMADAAVFTDCATGKRVAVANNAQLERDYAAARGTESKPVLLSVEGHFTLEANPDTGEQVKTLKADKDAKFIPGKACGN